LKFGGGIQQVLVFVQDAAQPPNQTFGQGIPMRFLSKALGSRWPVTKSSSS